jgi:hypothetical protein
MIHQDVLMRQLYQFTQAIASLIHQAPREQPDDVLRAIDEACQAHLDGRADDLRTLPPDALLELCRDGEHVVADAVQSMAQALQQMGDAYAAQDAPEKAGACFGRALLLYRHLLQDPDAPVSWQFGTTVAALAERVEVLPVDDATTEALDTLRNGTS